MTKDMNPKHVYRTAYAITKTKNLFSSEIIKLFCLPNNRTILNRMSKMFTCFYFDSIAQVSQNYLTPQYFTYTTVDMEYIRVANKGSPNHPDDLTMRNFEKRILEFFRSCINNYYIDVPKFKLNRTNGKIESDSKYKIIQCFDLS
jgi:hypothetical protein